MSRETYNEAFGVKTPERPEVPDCATHVWEWFWELHATRAPSFDGLAPISPRDILAWSQVTGNIVLREEAALIFAMDRAMRDQRHIEHEAMQARNKKE